MSESSDVTPRTIVGVMYFIGGSVSPPETMFSPVLSNNPLTRAKYASVGVRRTALSYPEVIVACNTESISPSQAFIPHGGWRESVGHRRS